MLRYGQFCPVAKTAEILADRWTPLIVRELCFGPCTFGDLLFAMPLISRTMLAQRLREMADAEVISIEPKSQGRGHLYRLTSAGEDFRPIIELMSAWGQRWNQTIAPEDLNPTLLMFGARRQIERTELPSGRTVIRFEFRGVPKAKANERYWWLVIHRPEPEVCLKNPGFEVDAVVSADLAAFIRVALGYLACARRWRAGSLASLAESRRSPRYVGCSGWPTNPCRSAGGSRPRHRPTWEHCTDQRRCGNPPTLRSKR